MRSGHWRRCANGVYFAEDRPFTDAARVRSSVWSYGTEATTSGLAAAWWHGLTRFAPKIVEVTVPRTATVEVIRALGCVAETWRRQTLSSTEDFG